MADLIIQNPSAMVVLGGDLNARLGPNSQTLYTRFGQIPPDWEAVGPLKTRASKDQMSNFAGLCLAQMTYKLGLHILNGTLGKDHPAEFTFLSGIRMSAIDYIIVSEDLLQYTNNMEVLARCGSDNFPVLLYLTGIIQKEHNEGDPECTLRPVGKTLCRAKWTPSLSSKVTKMLNTETL